MMRAVWLAGAAVLLGLLAIGLVRLRGVRRTGLPWMERRDEAMRVARDAGVTRPVAVMLHERRGGADDLRVAQSGHRVSGRCARVE